MGLYHSVGIAYGFEIPTTTDLDAIERALGEEPNNDPDCVGYTIVGDWDKALLCTRYRAIAENAVLPLVADELASVAELSAWDSALHHTAVRLGHEDHPEPGWLLIHNYR
jgi:hypothetical protein